MTTLRSQRFVCIDCETTGLDAQRDRIIEVAVMSFDFDQVYDQMESLVDPQCAIPPESIDIHHITTEMVAGKPTIDSLLPPLLELIGSHIIIGHGIQFDVELIALAAERHRLPCTIRHNRQIDTLRLARLYGDCPINSLRCLAQHFNVPLEGAHRAMNDVIANCEVFKHLSKPYRSTEELFQILSKPILMSAMPFGKHKGRPFKEIPLQYLQWLANKDFDQDLLYSIRTELKRRKQGNQFYQAGNPFLTL